MTINTAVEPGARHIHSVAPHSEHVHPARAASQPAISSIEGQASKQESQSTGL
jgi:hypothetical protein